MAEPALALQVLVDRLHAPGPVAGPMPTFGDYHERKLMVRAAGRRRFTCCAWGVLKGVRGLAQATLYEPNRSKAVRMRMPISSSNRVVRITFGDTIALTLPPNWAPMMDPTMTKMAI